MFRDDFEFHDGAAPSHLGGPAGAARAAEVEIEAAVAAAVVDAPAPGAGAARAPDSPAPPAWRTDAEAELRKIPFFVRGKARRNTERYAAERGVADITIDTLYEAKAHYAR
jgi:light-independent protochlorophyllide reductase subunit B